MFRVVDAVNQSKAGLEAEAGVEVGMWGGEGEFVAFFIAISEDMKMANRVEGLVLTHSWRTQSIMVGQPRQQSCEGAGPIVSQSGTGQT